MAAIVTAVSADVTQLSYAAPQVRAGAGAVLLFGSGAPVDLRSQLHRLTSVAPGLPPVVMADEEGGEIQRVANAVGNLPWARTAALTFTLGRYAKLVHRVGVRMADLGITMDLAPVLDLDAGPGPDSAHPDGRRSFSADPTIATAYGEAFVRALSRAGVIPVLKHFPGLGTATSNTDSGKALIAPLADLERADLMPFRNAITAGASAVMVNNALVTGALGLPLALQRRFVTGLLRHELGFRGLIVTDSLTAGALTSAHLPPGPAAVAALKAGVDLVLDGNLGPSADANTFATTVSAITAAVRSGELHTNRLRQAATMVRYAQAGVSCLNARVTAPTPSTAAALS